jgi:hypothetical protein
MVMTMKKKNATWVRTRQLWSRRRKRRGVLKNGTVHGNVDDGEDGVDQDDEDDDGLPRQRVQYDPQPPTRPATAAEEDD